MLAPKLSNGKWFLVLWGVASLVSAAMLWIWVERSWGVLVMGPFMGLGAVLIGSWRAGAIGYWVDRSRKLKELADDDVD